MNHDDVVIVAAARTPQGRLKGQLASLTAVQLGSAAIRGALATGRHRPPTRSTRCSSGRCLPAGAGQNPARQAAVGAGIPWDVHSGLGQQGLPLGSHRDHRRRAHDRRRRRDGRRRGGHGVDDPLAAPAHGLTRRLGVRLDRGARPHGVRRAHRRVRPREHGRVDRAPQRAGSRSRARRRMRSPPGPTSAQPRRPRPASSTPRSSPSRSRSARATRSS